MSRTWLILCIWAIWLTSMSWLVHTQLLPYWLAGPPPSNQTVYSTGKPGDEQPIGWRLDWGGQPVGWAVLNGTTNQEGYSQIRSHAHFENVPYEELMPLLFRGALRHALRVNSISLDAESRITLDSDGNLVRLTFIVNSPQLPDTLRVDGRLEGTRLLINIQAGARQILNNQSISADALIGNDLTPLARLPNLYPGQTWNIPSYSPFGVLNQKYLETLQAKVERRELLELNGAEVPVWLVVLRREAGTLLSSTQRTRGKLWVDQAGDVLRQEIYLNNARLTFTRVGSEESLDLQARSDRLRAAIRPDWRAYDPTPAESSEAVEDLPPSQSKSRWPGHGYGWPFGRRYHDGNDRSPAPAEPLIDQGESSEQTVPPESKAAPQPSDPFAPFDSLFAPAAGATGTGR